MNHKLSEVKVYETTDYNRFMRINGNRSLNNLKIKKMVKDIGEGLNFLADFPIVTSAYQTKLRVHDGQHRLEAAIKAKKPVFYIIRSEMKLDEMAKVNSLQEKWKPKDFVNCYIERGNKDYGVLNDFVDQYEVPINVAAKLLFYGVTGASDSGSSSDFRRMFEVGQFKAKHLKQATEIMESCKLFSDFDGWNSRGFMVAITKILQADKVDFDQLVEKVNKNLDMLEHQKNAKAYIWNLESIWNKGKQKREIIY